MHRVQWLRNADSLDGARVTPASQGRVHSSHTGVPATPHGRAGQRSGPGRVPFCISGDPHQSPAGWRSFSSVCLSGQGPPRESRAVSRGDPAPSHTARAAVSRPVGVPDAAALGQTLLASASGAASSRLGVPLRGHGL